MKKIILLSGLWGHKWDIKIIKRILNNYEVIYFNYKTSLKDTFETNSKKLDSFIKSLGLKKKEKVNLIGISAGGIIASYYVRFINHSKINKLVTIASPLEGNFFGYFFPKRYAGARQFIPNSKFIKKLNSRKSKVKEINYWCFFDMVFSGTSSRGTNGKHMGVFFHPIVQFWPPLLRKIKIFFDE